MKKIFMTSLFSLIILSTAIVNVYAQSTDTLQLKNSVLVIKSKPSQSIVYIDSEFVGYTPFTLSAIKGKHHLIQIQENGFLDFRSDVYLNSNDTLIVNAILKSFYGSICVFADNNQSIIKIDGKQYGKGRIDSLSLINGAHEINIYEPSVKKEISSSFNVDSQKRLTIKYEHNIVAIPRLLYSTILPGYAQFDDGNYSEGIGFTLAGIGSIIYMLSENAKYGTAEDEYKFALTNYDRASTDLAVEQAKNIANRKHDTYQIMKRRFDISIGTVVLVWVGNAFDLILNHLLTDRIVIHIDNAPIYSQSLLHIDYNISLAIGI